MLASAARTWIIVQAMSAWVRWGCFPECRRASGRAKKWRMRCPPSKSGLRSQAARVHGLTTQRGPIRTFSAYSNTARMKIAGGVSQSNQAQLFSLVAQAIHARC